MAEEINVLSHLGALVVGGGVYLGGRLIYDGIKGKKNNNSKYLLSERHEVECGLKLKPINDGIEKIEKTQEKIFDKMDSIHQDMPKRNGDK